MKIVEFKTGLNVESFLLVKNVEEKVASNGNPFLSIEFGDNTGSIHGILFDETKKSKNISDGDIVKIGALVQTYENRVSLKVTELFKITQDLSELGLSTADFVKTYPHIEDGLEMIYKMFISKMENQDLAEIASAAIEKAGNNLYLAPASKGYHHNYVGGLIKHIYKMLCLARSISKIYPNINKDYLYAGVVLHDIAKVFEYELDNLGQFKEETFDGLMLGYSNIGIEYISKIFNEINSQRKKEEKELLSEKMKTLLQHFVISHKGDFGEKNPLFKEAMILNQIDMMDSKIEMYEEEEEKVANGEFSDFSSKLGSKVYKI